MLNFLRYGEDYRIVKKSKYFNSRWYKKIYKVKGNPISHYCKIGYRLGYNPSPIFSRIRYELIYDDVRYVKANPVVHFEKYGKYEPTFLDEEFINAEDNLKIKEAKQLQNENIKVEYNKNCKNLIIFLVPDIDFVGGGVMSINSIATNMRNMKEIHNSEVLLCTVPSKRTFFEYSKFKCNFHIYRFEQICKYFNKLDNVVIHIPEIYVYHLLYYSTPNQINWMKNISNLTFNILNQNMDYMPRPRYVDYLKEISPNVTITCAHKKYCTKQLRTSYDASVHLLSTSNMVKYKYIEYEKKKNVLLYSPDIHPMKDFILNKIRDSFPEMELIEIKNMKYVDYLKAIGKAKWMITFGEGLDGYFCESIRSGTLAFSVYNLTFFNENYSNLENIYQNYNDMLENIVEDIKKLDNKKNYNRVVEKCIEIDKKEYNDEEYVENIKKYCCGDYTYKYNELLENRKKIIESNPLVSIALATYNGEKYIEQQLESLFNLDYKNLEIVVSDDHSTDATMKILNKYKDRIKIFQNKKKGLNSNFENAIRHCHGEFIALCDQDDIWQPNKIDVLLEHIDDFDLVFSGLSVINKNGEYYDNKYMHIAYEKSRVDAYHFHDFIRENNVLGCTTLIRTSFLKKYMEIPTDVIYHDWWFVLQAIKNGNGIVYIDNELIKYRQHNNNTAYNTYNKSDWFVKKIKFNECIKNNINLLDNEIKLINIDSNYNKVKSIFKKYIPKLTENFFDDNYYYFTDDFLLELKNDLNISKKSDNNKNRY